jgi:hypothetical protein
VSLGCLLLTGQVARGQGGASTSSREYQVKAAFLYNFINFVDWPKEKTADSNEPITIVIVGKDPFGRAFEPITNKKIKNRKVIVKRFSGFAELKKSRENRNPEAQRQIIALRKCHLVFICSSEAKKHKEITNLVKDHSVLTVADVKGFLESGGVINFVIEDKKVRFEINIAAAKQAKLKIRSQLLRLAKRVITEQ